MQDPRLRLLIVIVLSLIAFASVQGAVLAFAWWACTIEGPARLWQSRRTLVIFLPLFAVSLVLLVTGGNWAFYSLRIAVVLLIALFAYQDQSPGEFLGVCTWLFGGRAGFDCGIAGEISSSASEHWRAKSRRQSGRSLSKEYQSIFVASFLSLQDCSTIPSGERTIRPISSWLGGTRKVGRAVFGSKHRNAISNSQLQPL